MIICIAVGMLMACSRGEVFRKASGLIWGTEYHITYKSDVDLADSILAVMERVDLSLSPFREGSLISRVNAGEDVVVDSLWVRVMDISQRVNALSNGAFDPTVSPLVNLWGFGYRDGSGERPSPSAIDSALVTVGIDGCSIDERGHLVRKHPATEFNFSAVAKGFGVDLIAEMLRRNGCTDFMVEVGGEVALSGNGPSGDKWRIQVDAPIDDTTGTVHERMRVIHSTDIGIATSGNYRNFRLTPQGKVAHTISPTTGYPVLSDILSSTVIAPTTAEADALATAIMAMPLDSARAMLARLPYIDYLLVVHANNGMRVISNFE